MFFLVCYLANFEQLCIYIYSAVSAYWCIGFVHMSHVFLFPFAFSRLGFHIEKCSYIRYTVGKAQWTNRKLEMVLVTTKNFVCSCVTVHVHVLCIDNDFIFKAFQIIKKIQFSHYILRSNENWPTTILTKSLLFSDRKTCNVVFQLWKADVWFYF